MRREPCRVGQNPSAFLFGEGEPPLLQSMDRALFRHDVVVDRIHFRGVAVGSSRVVVIRGVFHEVAPRGEQLSQYVRIVDQDPRDQVVQVVRQSRASIPGVVLARGEGAVVVGLVYVWVIVA